VDASPFMLTRTMERIDSSTIEKAPTTWRFAFIATSVVVLSLNVSIFFKLPGKQNSNDIEEMVSSMDLSNANNLHYG
jgi:hypothetical protein